MRAKINAAAAIVAFLLASGPAPAQQQLAVYPAKGQSAQQQEKDKYDCYQWAVNETGFNPMTASTSGAAPPPEQPQSSAVKGAAKGAAVGALGGAIAGNAGTGAAVGAGVGAVGGGAKRRKQEQQAQSQAQQAQEQQQEKVANFNSAQTACLQGRGYTVK